MAIQRGEPEPPQSNRSRPRLILWFVKYHFITGVCMYVSYPSHIIFQFLMNTVFEEKESNGIKDYYFGHVPNMEWILIRVKWK